MKLLLYKMNSRISLFSYMIKSLHEMGLFSVLRVVVLGSGHFVYYKILKAQNTFTFQGTQYHYYYSLRNVTWLDERCVEIPIIMQFVDRYRSKKILEIGNVLTNYFRVEHEVLDKYEVANGVINQDVVSFKSNHKYDLIVSISTLEHVGWDENPRDDTKIPRSIENLKSLLNKNGRIVITLPLGYNTTMDKLLNDGIIKFTEQYYLKRISKGNKWIEVQSLIEVQGAKYGQSFGAKNFKFGQSYGANSLVIGIIRG